jgi:hypothetical protein
LHEVDGEVCKDVHDRDEECDADVSSEMIESLA